MLHVAPGMKSTLNKITMVQIAYTLDTGIVGLIAFGKVPGYTVRSEPILVNTYIISAI